MVAVFPLLVGLLLAAASLTPSLIPRDWILQGLLAGVCAAAGYVITVFLLAIWRSLQIPMLPRRWATICHAILSLPVLALLVRCVALSDDWQNSIRERMEMAPLEAANTIKMMLLASLIFFVFYALGWTFQGLFNVLRGRLARYIPVASANVLGLIIAALIVFIVTRDGVVNWALRVADQSYAAAQHLTDPSIPPPTESWRSGGPDSLSDWDLMGKPGRDFVLGGPRAAAIEAFTGRPAREPLRIYVGLAQDRSAETRARIALDEMLRTGAFDRKVLIVSSPTGTGWMDPASYDALEYMHDGDVATVAVQYSYLQSPLALIFETDAGLEQATATMRAVYDHWRHLPADKRPRLYLHGISLGAWSSMYSLNLFQMMNEPVSGAFWAGPPFPSELWRQANNARRPGSPFILPEVDDGEVIRYASQFDPPDRSGQPWGRMRILFLQHASDAIVFYNPASLWRAPEWMREPTAPDVSPLLSFTPIVTQFQLAVDMLVSTTTPPGFGHIYDAEEYIDGWVSVSAPEGWTAEDTARLKAKCGKDGLLGCDNR